MSKDNQKILTAKNVSLNIPVVSKTELSLKKTIIRSITGGKVSKNKNQTIIQALSNINLTIYSGQRIALIGHNGSGKSSFIRLISGIYEPSSGTLKRRVKAYPMLHKSFIVSNFLTGIDAAKAHYLLINNNFKGFDIFLKDIVDFSGLGDFISLPIRTYSEGMSARLMFSLLTYHAHDFLALDEGLGTGDVAIFEKAEKRLEKFINQAGTLILASHSVELLKKFCNRGIVFSEGTIVYDGELDDALEFYANRSSEIN